MARGQNELSILWQLITAMPAKKLLQMSIKGDLLVTIKVNIVINNPAHKSIGAVVNKAIR